MTDSTKPSLIRQIRRLHARREPLNLTAVKRRHPELLAAVYAVRPFWGWKQALEDAGIDYAKINVELEDSCICLICGAQAAILTSHLMDVHQTTPEEYRREFPRAEIVSETVRVAQRWTKAAPIIPHWEPLWSWEYVLDRAWEFHRRGWSLNSVEIQKHDRPLYSFTWFGGWDWDEVLQALGLDPADIRKLAVGAHLSEADVVRKLRQRAREGKSVAESFVRKDDMQLHNAARRRFGSHTKALEAAGFDPAQVLLRRPGNTITQLRANMARVAALHGHPRAIAAAALKKQ